MWEEVAAISSAIAAALSLFSVLIIIWQLKQGRQSTDASNFLEAYRLLQENEFRNARLKAYELDENKKYENITENEKKETIDYLCQRYDSIAYMVKKKMIKKEYVLNHWAYSINRLKGLFMKRIEELNRSINDSKRWDSILWLIKELEKK